jgi:hypothetical protein
LEELVTAAREAFEYEIAGQSWHDPQASFCLGAHQARMSQGG